MSELNDNVNRSRQGPEDGVLDLIHTIMHQYRSQQYQVLRDGPHDVTHMESKVLNYFERHPSATQSDLAQHTGRNKAQLARLIKGLRDREFLNGEIDEADRRNVKLSLTATGKSIQHTLQRQAKRLNTKAVGGLNNEEQQQLLKLLQHLKSNLDS
ncbi:MarR family winged helix-turn-helix transcriptional regulator [Undibacterium sp.]|uniref:MarR family winged helix-turn-helix transcriptional regulator n=1 Tax=Undibacterium sp. TaxID=1914977 RepID=UPI002C5F01B0|nr:MarR family winged helix-turn-helix transcriptional regulator [Undibacterium sp.]HTD04431.1 MarR family winged helix-turn-helix transcriptional regulator [Undibacterium sp.]